MTWRALSSSVRSSSRRMASYPFSFSEEEQAGLPSPTAGRVPGGTHGISRLAQAGGRSPRSRPLGLKLWSSAPAERSRLGLSGPLSPLPSAVVSLDFGFLPVCPDPHMELECFGRVGKFPICSMQYCLASIFWVECRGFSGIFLASFSPLLW